MPQKYRQELAASAHIARITEVLARQMGLSFTPRHRTELERGMRSASSEFGFDDVDECIRWLLSAPLTQDQIAVLASHLTIGETYFLRDRALFDILETRVLPELIASRRGSGRRLRIWSAACCSGEEAYSLAIVVRKALPDLAQWKVTIQGSDINPRFLHKADQAVFTDWSFRGTSPAFKEGYCVRTEDGRWQLRREIREMVNFFYLNLAEDVYPSLLNQTNATDLILCRNVLIYFTPERAAQVVRNLAHCLVEGGWLLLGPNELSHVAQPELVPVHFPRGILYRKDSSRARAPENRPPATPASPPNAPDLSSIWPNAAAAAEDVPRGPAPLDRMQSSTAAYEQALGLYAQGRYVEAAELIANVDTPAAWALLARAWANMGRLADALASCERSIVADKCNPVSHYLQGVILHEHGAKDKALSAYRRALYLDPQFVLAHFALGNLARDQGEPAAARRHFDNALMLARMHAPEAHLAEGEGLTAGRLAEIIGALQQI